MTIPDILFHGTTARRWQGIQEDRLLRVAPLGVNAVSMSDDPRVALYFARMAVYVELSERLGLNAEPIILAVDAKALLSEGYKLERFSDPIWGQGNCDWEREVVCWTDVPLRFVKETNLAFTLPNRAIDRRGARNQKRRTA